MKNQLTLLLGIVIAVVLLAFMIVFQVRYDETAVVTTFGAAGARSVKAEPGPYFRLPPPIQSVYKFPRTVQLLEDQLEESTTSDNVAVIVRLYMVWRIDDPLKFYVRLKSLDNAQDQLRPSLRDQRKVIGQFSFDQLVNVDPAKLRLKQIETELTANINALLKAQEFGITAEHVGIRRLVLPEPVTSKVFDRMKQTRQTMAQNARSEGDYQAQTIKSNAEAVKKIIMAFAENRAQAIRTQGEVEAAEYYKAFSADENLANFLRTVETLRKVLPHNSTYVLDADQLNLKDMLWGGQKVAPAKPGGK